MSHIIDLAEVLRRREEPDRNCVLYDVEGQRMFIFSLEFELRGRRFQLDMPAYSAADAEARLAAIRAGGRIAGRVLTDGAL